MLSTTAEYALRMMVLLAEQDGRPTTCATLSEVGRIPQQYASKVLNTLRRAGMVKGQRGRYGGFVLGCDPAVVTLLDVVNIIDPLVRITECPLGRLEHAFQLCPMHTQIDKALGQLERALADLTLAALAQQSDRSPLCTGCSSDTASVTASVNDPSTCAGDCADCGNSEAARRG